MVRARVPKELERAAIMRPCPKYIVCDMTRLPTNISAANFRGEAPEAHFPTNSLPAHNRLTIGRRRAK